MLLFTYKPFALRKLHYILPKKMTNGATGVDLLYEGKYDGTKQKKFKCTSVCKSTAGSHKAASSI